MKSRILIPFNLAILACTCTVVGGEQPNVVLIFADDLGYGDLGCYGATKLKTPNIDRLAKEGRRFTDAHSASAVCTPSRYALLLGEYPFRKGLSRPVFLKTGLVFDPDRLTAADVMKNAGYATACIGKWHLGFGRTQPDWNGDLEPGPLEVGFDYYFGVPVVNSHPPFVFVENHRVVGLVPDDPFVFQKKAKTRVFPEKMGLDQIGGADAAHALYKDEAVGTRLTEKSLEWIKANSDRPFFLYLATTNIHHPFTPAPRFQGTSECGRYGDFVHELDWIVGEVINVLEEEGLADNTLVIFTSDNGGMINQGGQDAIRKGHKLNGHLLGFKFDAWEGGHRVPFVARWPGMIEAGSVSDQLISNVDLLGTLAALTGQKLEPGEGPDSYNVLPALTRTPEKPVRDHLVLAAARPTHLALREGKWMFIGAKGGGGFGGTRPGEHLLGGPAALKFAGQTNSDIVDGKFKKDAPAEQLYNLDADPSQSQNVIRENAELAKAMRARLEKLKGSDALSAAVEPKYDGFKPLGKLRFTFESGKLDGWSIVEGKAGRPVSEHSSLARWKHKPFNREGRFHLSTIAAGDGFSDKQTVVLQSPSFVIHGHQASFLASGGFDPESLFVGLFDAETEKVLLSAGGPMGPQMQRTIWDVRTLKGKTVFIRVVDRNTGGWGHLTFDDFSMDGTIQSPIETPP